ncbi:hypothetical protein [Albibacillus kandeliae]|uniref:hypothetical protein n=1 Tax=Albibacillus kandeliae TaxID=2174228 RepID=UPI000D68BA08|nr:hypothetical protein [Albibacillus kandeliae]
MAGTLSRSRAGRQAIGLALLVLGLGLGAPVEAAQRAATSGRALVVRDDAGGVVQARVAKIASLRSQGQTVELRGRFCLSACTLYLGLPGACVSPQTKFGFHGPSLYGRPLKTRDFERWSHLMAGYYPEPLRDWFMSTARYRLTGYETLSGADLIDMGIARC